jgi:peptidoglycan/LPS O-acetylase OafA/YrhL
VATTLMASGGLLFAASWQRWAGACPWGGDRETEKCEARMDHLYDFLPPLEPWMPAGVAAQLAGASLLVLAVAVLLLPWALTGRKPGLTSAGAVLAIALIEFGIGLAALRSGLDGAVVSPVAPDITLLLWFVAPPVLFAHLAVLSRGWASRAAAVLLVLASPLIASFTYAIGPWDAQPWWEAVSGLLTCGAGACVLVAALRRPARRRDAVVEPAGAI